MVQIDEASVDEVPSLRRPSQLESPTVVLADDIATHSTSFLERKGSNLVIFSFFEELGEPAKKLLQAAWAARGKMAHDVKSYTMLMVTMVVSMPGRITKVVSNPRLYELFTEEEDPQALAAVLCGTSGALCLGSSGAVIGATVGGACGLALGAVPAIFTFGLSLPIGALIGGALGFGTGAAVGGTSGLGAGAASGMTVAYLSEDIKYVVLGIASRVYDVYDFIVVRPVTAVKTTGKKAGQKARDVGGGLSNLAGNPAVRAGSLGAVTGGAALGTAGAAGGAMCGGTAGALLGIVPAIFTFGLSIPVGALIGGSTGLCVGATAGTTVGATVGGLAGAGGYTYRGVPNKTYKLFSEFFRERPPNVAEAD